MTRKRNGFWTFVFSLMPGAGEMYLGFMKQGVSLMTIFLAWCAFCMYFHFEAGLFIVPVIWFYSFFHVHNLASLPDEEFYQQEDDYIFPHADRFVGADRWERGKMKFVAAALIVIGAYVIISTGWDMLWRLMPDWMWESDIGYALRDGIPRVAISFVLICFGIYLIRGKKQKLDEQDEPKDLP